MLLSTVTEVNERILPAITLRPNRLGREPEFQEEEEERGEEEDEIQSPELDFSVLKPLEFDPMMCGGGDGAPSLALHHRRRFSRQRGSISLDGISFFFFNHLQY